MRAKSIVTGGARLSGLREKRRLLNPLDLIWFVPAWGSKGFIIVDENNNSFFLTAKPGSSLNPVFLCWC
jgi:phosphomethylpyrimidine synthase